MNIKNIIIVGVAGALVLLLGLGIGLLVGGNQSVKSLSGITNYDSLTLSGDLVVGGAISLTGVPTFSASSISSNGVVEYFNSSSINNAARTLCSFASPASTSTLEFASISLTTGTTTATTIYIATAATATATTTALGSEAVASLALPTIVASTTPGQAGKANVIAPNQYINFDLNGTAGVKNVLVGTCKVKFLVN